MLPIWLSSAKKHCHKHPNPTSFKFLCHFTMKPTLRSRKNPPLPAAAKDPRPFPRWWWQQHYGLGRPEQWRMVRALDLVKDLCLDLQAMRTTLLSNFHKKNVKATHNRMFVAVLMYRRYKNMNAPCWFGHVWPPITICFEAWQNTPSVCNFQFQSQDD